MWVGEDLSRWSYWWEYRKDPFLGLRRQVHLSHVVPGSDEFYIGSAEAAFDTLRPTPSQVEELVAPALLDLLEATDQRDIVSACLIALAKAGVDAPGRPLVPALRARLSSHDQEIRETAALALGISGRSEALHDLVALAADSARGRELCDRDRVDVRTRSFALYGLGVLAWSGESATIKSVVFETARAHLDPSSHGAFDQSVAALTAIGLLRVESLDDRRRAERLRAAALGTLERYLEAALGAGRQRVQAHVPAAAAALLRGSDDRALRRHWQQTLAGLLDAGRGASAELEQSAVLALGRLAEPHTAKSKDAWVSQLLMDVAETARDQQVRLFARAALGSIGGKLNENWLLSQLIRGQRAVERPWAALGLGVLEYRRQLALAAAAGGGGRRPAPNRALCGELREQLRDVKTPRARGAFAIALGLCRDREAVDELRVQLERNLHQDELAGYLCISLGLIGDHGSVQQMRKLVVDSKRRPQRMLQAAVALGRVGDKTAARLLTDTLCTSGNNVAVMGALAFAIGQIGDRRSIDDLLGVARDESLTPLSRAFAVVALGGVVDKEDEPWNAKIGRLVNYRAAVATLTDQLSGVLDIF